MTLSTALYLVNVTVALLGVAGLCVFVRQAFR